MGRLNKLHVTITGADDASVITGTVTGAVLEGNVGDAPVTATGSIAITDVDDDDNPVFNDVGTTVGDNSLRFVHAELAVCGPIPWTRARRRAWMRVM